MRIEIFAQIKVCQRYMVISVFLYFFKNVVMTRLPNLSYQGNSSSSGDLKIFGGFPGNGLLCLANNAFCLRKFQHLDILSKLASPHNPAVIFDVIKMITIVKPLVQTNNMPCKSSGLNNFFEFSIYNIK